MFIHVSLYHSTFYTCYHARFNSESWVELARILCHYHDTTPYRLCRQSELVSDSREEVVGIMCRYRHKTLK
ncbi:MAG: hypothetical protein IJC11_06310 [Alphaproteobacteria bacterium]|nr:hypothetical protein [Alphaproteobacteria bacterium]